MVAVGTACLNYRDFASLLARLGSWPGYKAWLTLGKIRHRMECFRRILAGGITSLDMWKLGHRNSIAPAHFINYYNSISNCCLIFDQSL